jgi:hypothetical protein
MLYPMYMRRRKLPQTPLLPRAPLLKPMARPLLLPLPPPALAPTHPPRSALAAAFLLSRNRRCLFLPRTIVFPRVLLPFRRPALFMHSLPPRPTRARRASQSHAESSARTLVRAIQRLLSVWLLETRRVLLAARSLTSYRQIRLIRSDCSKPSVFPHTRNYSRNLVRFNKISGALK